MAEAAWATMAAIAVAGDWVEESNWSAMLTDQAALLRDIINPFFSEVLSPTWLKWNNAVALRIAQEIYNERRFACLPILGDALEEAGCPYPELLNHCRQTVVHVLGCWAVDTVLGLH
jgi:hypothetical protein